MSANEMLKTTEAAVVSSVAVRDVNRVIDDGILPEGLVIRDDGRYILAAACMFVSFYFEAAASLTPEERLFAIEAAVPRLRRPRLLTFSSLLKEDWIVRHSFLTIDLLPFAKKTSERLAKLVAARNLVHSTPEILSGTPVILGTRVPVHDVGALVAAGVPLSEILSDYYPHLDADKVELARIYTEAYPVRGRPRSRTELPEGAVIVSDYRARLPRPKKSS
jgi:uncharacterized protein (DUF433 family)